MSVERVTAFAAGAVVVALATAASAQARPNGRAAAAAPTVQSMVVGRGGRVLAGAGSVTASATTVGVGGRSCAVAAGTPLAALAAVRRGGGPGFALHDYGRCGSSGRNSGELFVYSLGGETNSGQSGWEYKVDDVAGSTGAGDASGPLGNGRLLGAGERVLWFWCEAHSGGCQRTLEVGASATTVSRDGALTVAVTGYDNDGRGAPVAGAIVTLGTDFASTGASGRATLIAPSTPGRYTVSAARRGVVPSFPETIVVR